MRGDERWEIDALGRYWDELAQRRIADRGAVDQSLAGAVDGLRALDARDRSPSPDPAFVRKLEEGLMSTHGGAAVVPVPSAGPVPSTGGQSLPLAGTGAGRVGRRPVRRFPFAQLLSAAVVLLTLSSVVVAYRLLPQDGGKTTAPPAVLSDWERPEPDVPPASACRVAPSAAEPVQPSGPPTVPAALRVREDRSMPGELPVVELDALPVGPAAEEQTIDAVAATLREAVACSNAAYAARHVALFTADYSRRPNASRATRDPAVAFLAPTIGRRTLAAAVPALASVQTLRDGRVGALVIARTGTGDDPSGVDAALYVVLAERGKRWAIDEAARINAITNVIETAEYPFTPVEGNGTPAGASPPDATFSPIGIETGADAPLLLVVHNREPEPLTFAIDEIGVRVDVAPGRFVPVVVEAPPGSYRYTGSLAGRRSLGLTGRLVLHPTGTPAPATPAAIAHPSPTIESFDLGFDPAVVAIPADTEVVLTVESQGTADHTFTVDALGIDVAVAAGETREVRITASAGEYEFYSSAPNHREVGMVGTLRVEGGTDGTPAATPTGATPTMDRG